MMLTRAVFALASSLALATLAHADETLVGAPLALELKTRDAYGQEVPLQENHAAEAVFLDATGADGAWVALGFSARLRTNIDEQVRSELISEFPFLDDWATVDASYYFPVPLDSMPDVTTNPAVLWNLIVSAFGDPNDYQNGEDPDFSIRNDLVRHNLQPIVPPASGATGTSTRRWDGDALVWSYVDPQNPSLAFWSNYLHRPHYGKTYFNTSELLTRSIYEQGEAAGPDVRRFFDDRPADIQTDCDNGDTEACRATWYSYALAHVGFDLQVQAIAFQSPSATVSSDETQTGGLTLPDLPTVSVSETMFVVLADVGSTGVPGTWGITRLLWGGQTPTLTPGVPTPVEVTYGLGNTTFLIRDSSNVLHEAMLENVGPGRWTLTLNPGAIPSPGLGHIEAIHSALSDYTPLAFDPAAWVNFP